MKKLKLKPPIGDDWHMRAYADDIERMVRIAASKGFILSPSDACKAWEEYSETYAAGWLIMEDDDEAVWKHISFYLEEE